MKLVAKTTAKRERLLDERDQKSRDLMDKISGQAKLIVNTAWLLDDLAQNSGAGKMDYDHISTCGQLLRGQVKVIGELEDELDTIESYAERQF